MARRFARAPCFRMLTPTHFSGNGPRERSSWRFRSAIRGIKMDGPCAKVNMVLAEEPRFIGTPPGSDPQQRSLFTLVPSLEFAERCYDIAKFGEHPRRILGRLCNRIERAIHPLRPRASTS